MNDQIRQAVLQLKAGHLVAIPTETVYGLAADANNSEAVKKIFATKGRPSGHPLIVHVAMPNPSSGSESNWGVVLGQWSRDVSPEALVLAEKFWPGPLTMILPKAKNVLNEVTGGQETVGIRCPSHPLAQHLLNEFGGGLAAPSANRFGRISPTTAEHVKDEFPDSDLLILDGGPCAVGIESTIVDLTRLDSEGAVVLRLGAISQDQIHAALSHINSQRHLSSAQSSSDQPRVSGSLSAHYAPRTKMLLYPSHGLNQSSQGFQLDLKNFSKIAWVHFSGETINPAVQQKIVEEFLIPNNPTKLAKELYALLRKLDKLSVDLILFESLPNDSSWDAVRDRLGRASVGSGI